MGVCLSGCNIEAQHEQNGGRGGGTQGIKVAHFYVRAFLFVPTALQPCREIMCTHGQTSRWETMVVSLSNCGSNSWWPGHNEKSHTSALGSDSVYPNMPKVQSPMSDIINYVPLTSEMPAEEGGIHFIRRLFKKIVFQAGLTACIPITSSPRSEIADSSPAVRHWVSLNVFGL